MLIILDDPGYSNNPETIEKFISTIKNRLDDKRTIIPEIGVKINEDDLEKD